MAGQMAVLGEAVVRLGWGLVMSFGGLCFRFRIFMPRCHPGLVL